MTGASTDLKESGAEIQNSADRLVFVDVLRVGVIVWVIGHHAAQPYGPTGGDWPIADQGNLEWLGPLYPLGASFGMGLLFLLAGYFVPRSFDRKGADRFLRERFWRIGLPMVRLRSAGSCARGVPDRDPEATVRRVRRLAL